MASPSGEAPAAIAIIIDDLGYRATVGRRTVRLPGPVACAILPHTPYAVELAKLAYEAGKEVLLHQPFEAIDSQASPEPGVIGLDTTRKEFARILNANLAAVPFAVGLNNHMGSLLTRHPGHMQWLMEELGKRPRMFFVDSRTTPSSVAIQLAIENEVPAIARHVFLDRDPTPAAVTAQLRRLEDIARRRGFAVAIGHPYPVTLDVLESELVRLDHENLRLVPVADIVNWNEKRLWPEYSSPSPKASRRSKPSP